MPILLRSSLLAGVPHGFTTRYGGVSRAGLASLNLARRPGESDASLVENWRRVAERLGREVQDVVLMSQVHGRRVLAVDEGSGPLAVVGEADALITTRPGLVLATRAADCVPILLAAPGGVAAVHSGWRGTAADVVGAAVEALCAATGGAPHEIRAAVGPRISGAAYAVGEEVVAALRACDLDSAVFARRSVGRVTVDLGAAVRAQLERRGVRQVDVAPVCTVADPRFFSHRGEGPTTGRFAGVIRLAA
jgi:YfiH family protein